MVPNPNEDNLETDGTSCITQDIFERDLILDELKRTLQFAATNIDQFRSRTTDLTAHQRKFNKIQTKIEKALIKLQKFNKEANIKIRNDFNDLYYAIVTHLNNMKEVDEQKRRASRVPAPLDTFVHDRRTLPKLSLPEYNGDPTGWPVFFDLFQSLVHNNNAYTDAEKFRYLLLSIKDEPHNLIKSIPITEDNYSVALDILKSRYDNKRIIASQHLDRLFDIETCTGRSAVAIRNLLNIYHENTKALEVMDFPVGQWDFVLLNLLLRKIPVNTRKEYERSLINPREIPKVNTLIMFLERELSADQMINVSSTQSTKYNSLSNHCNKSNVNIGQGQTNTKRIFAASVAPDQNRPYVHTDKVRSCLKCQGGHNLTRCLEFLDLSVHDRHSFVKTKNVCYNCLCPGHDVRSCKSNFSCRKCNKKHHTLIHLTTASALPVISDTAKPDAVSLAPTAQPATSAVIQNAYAASQRNLDKQESTVLLSTVLVDIRLEGNKIATVRCLADSGSQASIISESCVQRLNLPRRQNSTPILGIGDEKPVVPRGTISCGITPKGKQHPVIPIEAFILPKLMPKMPSVPLAPAEWPHLQGLALADPEFHKPQPVEMLLGADILSQILRDGVITGKPGTPIAMNSVFGYLLLGKLSLNASISAPLHSCFSSFDNENLQRFWELESVPEMRGYTSDEKLCESFFQKTHTRDDTGRYVVALPFKPDAPPLGESRQIALSRFHKMEYRLERNPQLKADYHACLQEYVDLNHMQLAEDNPPTGASYHIPHHSVVKNSSETTKTRIVYDAGCKTTSGYALNDTLLTGPKLHLDIVDVLLKFRVHNIAFCSDIKQMYRNILVREQDRDFQRILWRQSLEEPIRDYKLCTVTFGVSCSPYLALRTIKQLAHDEAKHFPLAAPVLLKDVFVDDIVTGADTVAGALALQQELVGICATAGFELRKWHSNSLAILAAARPPDFHGERRESVHFADMESDKGVKVLGLQWNSRSDSLSFQVQRTSTVCTKRAILSEIAKIYDPLGLLSPVTLFAKHLIQLLWLAKVPWDAEPPIDIVNSWTSFVSELPLLSQVSFPRYIFNTDDFDSIEIHGFADASQIAYAGCVYIRLTDKNGTVQTYLIMAKTRVAPLRVCLTIPRLELMACAILSKLIERVMQIYTDRIRADQVYAWSDSSVALAWLRSSPHEWKTFVSNRVSDILSRVPASCWRHVASADNSADPASRGLLPAALVRNDLWYHGPAWLQHSQDSWPVQKPVLNTAEEKRNKSESVNNNCSCVSTSPPTPDDTLITRFSSLGKLVRVTALIFRFYNKCRKHDQSFPEYITVPEYNFALNRLILMTQQIVFSDDIKNISTNKSPSLSLRRLSPMLDSDGLLRVGGRIHKSFLPYESKHQLILPKRHPLTNLIIDDTHINELHAGPQCVQNSLLQRYWIISGRDIVRLRVHRCIPCFRARPTRVQPRMGALPAVRLRPARVFLKTSCDFCGPFYVRANKVRNAKIVKCYVAVFVCMSVKAVHLEIVSELSTEGFLAALRRFTSRRGYCTDIYTDCGRNFLGCNNYLKDLYAYLRSDSVMSALNQQTLRQGLTWHFQPPYASHFGGLFEAAVKSFKTHLHRVIGTRTQTYDEMHTLTCQIEAVLNSRPLCVLSSDSSDPLPLTPSHFLIGEPLTALPDVSLTDENPNRLTRWRWIQQAVQHFWSRWSKEYLHQIQQSTKWLQDRGPALREGDVVVVCDDHLPPLQWKLARIHALHSGSDQVTRVVTLKGGNTVYKRPVVKVCPLPLE